MIDERDARELVRRLTGEDRRAGRGGPEAEGTAEGETRAVPDPELEQAWRELRRTWEALDLPEPAPASAGFPARVMVGIRAERGERMSWRAAPAWARAAAAAALACGVALGAWLGTLGTLDTLDAVGAAEGEEALLAVEPTLAETWWEVIGTVAEPAEDGS